MTGRMHCYIRLGVRETLLRSLSLLLESAIVLLGMTPGNTIAFIMRIFWLCPAMLFPCFVQYAHADALELPALRLLLRLQH